MGIGGGVGGVGVGGVGVVVVVGGGGMQVTMSSLNFPLGPSKLVWLLCINGWWNKGGVWLDVSVLRCVFGSILITWKGADDLEGAGEGGGSAADAVAIVV